MPQCFLLTQDDLNNMLSNGSTLIGGPFATQQDCDANCGSQSSGSGSQSGASSAGSSGSSSSGGGSGSGSGSTAPPICGCCGGNAIGQSLSMTITGCSCIDGTYTANYVPAYNAWRCAGGNFDFVLLCGGPSFFTLEDTHLLDGTVPEAPCQIGSTFTSDVTCNPFQAVFNTSTNPGTSCCCGAGVTDITVTFNGSDTSDVVCDTCCPNNPIPSTLTATLSNIECCECVGGSIPLMGVSNVSWTGTGLFCTGHNITLNLLCEGSGCGSFVLIAHFPDGCHADITMNQDSCSCDPFDLVYEAGIDMGAVCGCTNPCDGSHSFKVEITP